MSFGGFLKQSTAVDILIGPFVDSTDGDSEEVGLTIAAADVRVSKNGQTAATKSDVTTCAHDADGFYNCELDATDTNTVGQLVIYVHVAGALAVRHEYHVVEEAIYDSLFAASAAGFNASQQVAVGSIAASAITATSIASNAITAIKIATGAITSSKIAAGAIGVSQAPNLDAAISSRAAASVLGLLTSTAATGDPGTSATTMGYLKQLVNILIGTAGVTTFPAEAAPANAVSLAEVLRAIHDDVTGIAGAAMRGTDSAALASVATEARLAELDAANLPADIAAVKAETALILTDTAEIGAAGAGLTAVPWNAAWDVEVESEVVDGLVSQGLDHLVAAAVVGADVADNSIMARLVSASATADWDDFVNTTDSMQALRDLLTTLDGKLDTIDDFLDTEIAAILADVAELNDTKIPDTLSLANINGEVVDALSVDTYAEPAQGAPPATATLAEKVAYLYKAWRNRTTQDASEYALYNSAGTVVDHKAATSDDATTFDRANVVSGP